MSEDNNDYGGFLVESAKLNGAACATVSDGHVILFKLSYLKELLEKHSDQELLTIFVKRRDFKD